VSRYKKGKTNLDFTEARDSEWQWHQLGHMQVCTLLQTDNHASNPPLSFLQAGCPSCCPANSVKALKGYDNAKLRMKIIYLSCLHCAEGCCYLRSSEVVTLLLDILTDSSNCEMFGSELTSVVLKHVLRFQTSWHSLSASACQGE